MNKRQKAVIMSSQLRHENPLVFLPTDPEGSYTGIPEDPMETPVQDADDL